MISVLSAIIDVSLSALRLRGVEALFDGFISISTVFSGLESTVPAGCPRGSSREACLKNCNVIQRVGTRNYLVKQSVVSIELGGTERGRPREGR